MLLRRLTVECAAVGTKSKALLAYQGAQATLENCELRSSATNSGVVVKGGAALVMRGCLVRSCVESGVSALEAGTQATLERCQLLSNGMAGLVVYEGASASAAQCTLSENIKGGAIVMNPGSSVALEGCVLAANGLHGLAVQLGARAAATKCSLTGNAHYGVWFHGHATAGEVVGCDLQDNPRGASCLTEGAAQHNIRLAANRDNHAQARAKPAAQFKIENRPPRLARETGAKGGRSPTQRALAGGPGRSPL